MASVRSTVREHSQPVAGIATGSGLRGLRSRRQDWGCGGVSLDGVFTPGEERFPQGVPAGGRRESTFDRETFARVGIPTVQCDEVPVEGRLTAPWRFWSGRAVTRRCNR